ncbi:hypothetical protein WA158_006722 [Blastocystis sp. Blastoise]
MNTIDSNKPQIDIKENNENKIVSESKEDEIIQKPVEGQKRVDDDESNNESKKIKTDSQITIEDALNKIIKFVTVESKFTKAMEVFHKLIQATMIDENNSLVIFNAVKEAFSNQQLFLNQKYIDSSETLVKALYIHKADFNKYQEKHIESWYFLINTMKGTYCDDSFEYNKCLSKLKKEFLQLPKKSNPIEQKSIPSEDSDLEIEILFHETCILDCVRLCLSHCVFDWQKPSIFDIIQTIAINKELLSKDNIPIFNSIYQTFLIKKNPPKKIRKVVTKDVMKSLNNPYHINKQIGSGLQ